MGEDMAYGKDNWFFPLSGAVALVAMLGVAACTTPTEDVAQAPGRSGQPTDTGTFPNLNIPPKAAAAQLTDEETEAKLRQLEALKRRQQPSF